MHGYENTSVEEIRKILSSQFGVTDQEVLSQTKKPLVALLQEYMADEDSIENAEEEEDSILVYNDTPTDEVLPTGETIIDQSVMPQINSPKWQEYVLRQFADDELKDGNPTCDGCRRVVEELIGPLVDYGVSEYTPAGVDNKGTATVVYLVKVLVNKMEDHPLYGSEIHVTEIADSGPHNTDPPYCNHAAATAATRAESRCYRKLLRLRNTITAEEYSEQAEQFIDPNNWTPSDPIDDNQISIIDLMCKRLDINVMEFINSGQSVYTSIEFVTKSTAQKMLQELNKIQRGVKDRPTTIKSYDTNWRNA